MNNNLLSIVIPAYREELRLPRTVHKLFNYLNTVPDLPFEVVIVVEPSPDKTFEVAQSLSQTYPNIKILENEVPLGKGGSVRKGLLESKGEFTCFMDADGATDFSFLYKSYQKMKSKNVKVIIASRALKDSVIKNKQPFSRQVMGKTYRLLTRFYLGLPYQDTQCGCKIFHRSVIPFLFEEISEQGFSFDLEILLKAKVKHIDVLEMGCIWEDIDGSKVNKFKDSYHMLTSLYKLKRNYKK